MPQIDIYTKPYCPYCDRAKALLDRKGAAYNEIVASNDADLKAEMQKPSAHVYTCDLTHGYISINGDYRS